MRKRPINEREKATRDHDAVTTMNPRVAVHACKLRVDGITKYLENQMFEFDHVSPQQRPGTPAKRGGRVLAARKVRTMPRLVGA